MVEPVKKNDFISIDSIGTDILGCQTNLVLSLLHIAANYFFFYSSSPFLIVALSSFSSFLHYPFLCIISPFFLCSSSIVAVPCQLSLLAFSSIPRLSFCFLSSDLVPFRAPETDGTPILLSRSTTLCQLVEKQRVGGVLVRTAVS